MAKEKFDFETVAPLLSAKFVQGLVQDLREQKMNLQEQLKAIDTQLDFWNSRAKVAYRPAAAPVMAPVKKQPKKQAPEKHPKSNKKRFDGIMQAVREKFTDAAIIEEGTAIAYLQQHFGVSNYLRKRLSLSLNNCLLYAGYRKVKDYHGRTVYKHKEEPKETAGPGLFTSGSEAIYTEPKGNNF